MSSEEGCRCSDCEAAEKHRIELRNRKPTIDEALKEVDSAYAELTEANANRQPMTPASVRALAVALEKSAKAMRRLQEAMNGTEK